MNHKIRKERGSSIPRHPNHQDQQDYEALWREIETKRRSELENVKSKKRNPELEDLRRRVIPILKAYYPFFPWMKLLRDLESYKLDYCKNIEKYGTCNYGPKCNFYHGQNVYQLTDAILAKMKRNEKFKT